jgi:hypothetical protein
MGPTNGSGDYGPKQGQYNYCGYDGAYVVVDGVKSNVANFHP